MARKKKEPELKKNIDTSRVEGLRAEVLEQPITDTLTLNYMPYAMSVIVSRAIPEIDGFKPSHRKLLYTMYKMGLLNGPKTKSATIVGKTMQLNPHGDGAIYETMVRLARGNETLLVPFVDSKGNFGKVYSRDMAYAASRYTEAKLEAICQELFRDIDEETVDFVPNYDNTTEEPTLLPTAFPNVLVSANMGIAVGMASNICSFNLREVCKATAAWIRNPNCDLLELMPAPDFSTGGEILYDIKEMEEVYRTGRGSIKIRARWRYVKEGNLIEIYEIPYTTTTEAIIDKVAELTKAGKIREISDMRDETDLNGLKLAIDLKRGVDPDKLMQKLFKSTPLLDSFGCNFNLLIAGMPRVLGVREIIEEWTAWRTECVRRRVYHRKQKKSEKLHLLKGLKRILLDIDKAIRIIRETESDAEVIPNLMIGFGIDKVQAEYVAEIKLRNINKEYILKRTQEVDSLEEEIQELEDILRSERKIRNIIIKELDAIADKYGKDRKTGIVFGGDIEEEEAVPDYAITVFVSKEGYFKKITPQSLRMSGEQKFKEGDSLSFSLETQNSAEMLVFTDKYQVYKARCSDFEDSKASVLGDYLPGKLGFDEGEGILQVCFPGDYSGNMIFIYENGKVTKVELSTYQTKSNRRKLTGAYCDKSPLKAAFLLKEDVQMVLYSTENRALIFSTAQLAPKTTRATQGVAVMTLKKKHLLHRAALLEGSGIVNQSRYRTKSLPAAGALLKPEDAEEKQMELEL
ncbi:MAG: topoisomerase IV [Oscillospiraceae bacterium]|nr:topoisomerase IV [Oscillospiraceae bacterium]